MPPDADLTRVVYRLDTMMQVQLQQRLVSTTCKLSRHQKQLNAGHKVSWLTPSYASFSETGCITQGGARESWHLQALLQHTSVHQTFSNAG